MIFAFFITTFLIFLSTIGYGFLLTRILKIDQLNYNFGLIGILGLFLLSIISSYTHIVTPHNYIHNIIILSLGLVSFWLTKKKFNDLKFLIIIFAILFISLILAKNNEDFPYYHLPNTLQFAQQKLQFGLGNLNHGFKHISSLFMLMSLNYLPKFEYYLFNVTNYLFLVFFIVFLLKEIFHRNKVNLNLSQILLMFSLVLFLTKFSRLAEYGSDIASQIIIVIYFFLIVETYINKNLDTKTKISYYKVFLILITFAITTKFIYVIYVFFLIPILFSYKKDKKIFYNLLDLKFLIIIVLPLVFLVLFNFASTGCLVYPVTKLCFSNKFNWALSSEVVSYLNFYYELWSKAGAGVNFQVENQENYIKFLNWFPNWFSLYFFNKVSDYFLVILFILFVITLFFRKEIFNKEIISYNRRNNFILIYISLLIVFLLWFLNFPSLRYAGYIVIFLGIVFPFSIFLDKKINLSKKINSKKLYKILSICIIVFLFKNINRLHFELNLTTESHHNFKNFPFYWVQEKDYKKININNHDLFLVQGSCWKTPSTCIKDANIKVTKKNNYIFYSQRSK